MIAIINYDLGNLRSVQKGFERSGHQTVITRDKTLLAKADGVVLPGVGAFGHCMENLQKYGLVQPIKDVVASGKPFLGICLGMQLLFDSSDEFGSTAGLGIIHGRVKKFNLPVNLKVPHMGWNRTKQKKPSQLLDGVPDGAYVYFVHSYHVVPQESVTLTETEYGTPFVSAIEKQNIYATQFHPEKSQDVGLKILDNFAAICEGK